MIRSIKGLSLVSANGPQLFTTLNLRDSCPAGSLTFKVILLRQDLQDSQNSGNKNTMKKRHDRSAIKNAFGYGYPKTLLNTICVVKQI